MFPPIPRQASFNLSFSPMRQPRQHAFALSRRAGHGSLLARDSEHGTTEPQAWTSRIRTLTASLYVRFGMGCCPGFVNSVGEMTKGDDGFASPDSVYWINCSTPAPKDSSTRDWQRSSFGES